jgi:RNA polymerase sigma factor (TIGR02999 family)
MPSPPAGGERSHDVTRILAAIEAGEAGATDDLLPIVYDELRDLARQRLAQERPGQTLQATALVHEAYLRLVGGSDDDAGGWEGRGHFFGAAALAMRRILVERARRRGRVRHGGGRARVDLDVAVQLGEEPDDDLLALDTALDDLEAYDERKARVVLLRHFGGLGVEETAAALDVSPATVKSDWSFARAWLHRKLTGDEDATP